MKSLIQDLSHNIYSVKFTIIDANDVHTFDVSRKKKYRIKGGFTHVKS